MESQAACLTCAVQQQCPVQQCHSCPMPQAASSIAMLGVLQEALWRAGNKDRQQHASLSITKAQQLRAYDRYSPVMQAFSSAKKRWLSVSCTHADPAAGLQNQLLCLQLLRKVCVHAHSCNRVTHTCVAIDYDVIDKDRQTKSTEGWC